MCHLKPTSPLPGPGSMYSPLQNPGPWGPEPTSRAYAILTAAFFFLELQPVNVSTPGKGPRSSCWQTWGWHLDMHWCCTEHGWAGATFPYNSISLRRTSRTQDSKFKHGLLSCFEDLFVKTGRQNVLSKSTE